MSLTQILLGLLSQGFTDKSTSNEWVQCIGCHVLNQEKVCVEWMGYHMCDLCRQKGYRIAVRV